MQACSENEELNCRHGFVTSVYTADVKLSIHIDDTLYICLKTLVHEKVESIQVIC